MMASDRDTVAEATGPTTTSAPSAVPRYSTMRTETPMPVDLVADKAWLREAAEVAAADERATMMVDPVVVLDLLDALEAAQRPPLGWVVGADKPDRYGDIALYTEEAVSRREEAEERAVECSVPAKAYEVREMQS